MSKYDSVRDLQDSQTGLTLDPDLPICVRLDGHNFKSYTKSLKKPFDERLSNIMIETMSFLVKTTNAKLGYTQSDEISLVYFNTKNYQDYDFNGKIQKITSLLASKATNKFSKGIYANINEKFDEDVSFDCRAWNVPTLKDAADVFAWRQEDAIKNSISMAASAHFNHKSLEKKNSKTKIEMLKEKGIDWNEYPDYFKSGTFCCRELVKVSMPEKLKQFKNNDKDFYYRSSIKTYHLPKLSLLDNVENLLFSDIQEYESQKRKKLKV